MALDNYTMNFEAQTTHKVPTRDRLAKWAKTPLAKRARFEVSEGVRPAEYFAPYRYLPVLEKDITNEDFVVIPKGRILSSITVFDTAPDGGLKKVGESGVCYGFDNQVDGGIGSYSQDDSYFGYDEYITNILVPANGGVDATYWYTAKDEQAGTFKPDGTYAAAGDTVEMPANMPVGVAFHDWFQDIRGKYLNYRMWQDGGHVLTDWYVEVPYAIQGSGEITMRATGTETEAERNAYAGASDAYSYLSVTEAEFADGVFRPGAFVKADAQGNYMPQYATVAAGIDGQKTVQTVGKLVGIDTRFPKSSLDEVQTYPGSRMPGTQTAGLPSFLFEFVVAAEVAKGNTTITIEDVLKLVQAGKYGVARIQLLVS